MYCNCEEYLLDFYTDVGVSTAKCKELFTSSLSCSDGVTLRPRIASGGVTYAVFICHRPRFFSVDVLRRAPILLDRYGVDYAVCTDPGFTCALRPSRLSRDAVASLMALLRQDGDFNRKELRNGL